MSERSQASKIELDRLALNRLVGWTSLAAGALTGLILGLWSFDGPVPAPGGLEAYGDLSRRLARLGHIAFFGLGILNLLLANELAASQPPPSVRRFASGCMNFGNIFLPLTLFAAAAWHPLKYLMPLPAISVAVAMGIGGWQAWRTRTCPNAGGASLPRTEPSGGTKGANA